MLKKILLLALCVGLLSARVVVDSYGKKVQVPDEITRAMPMIPVLLQISLMLDNEDKIIFGSPRMPPKPLLNKVFPKIELNPNKSGVLSSSVESIIAAKAQVVFGPVGLIFDENAKKQLEAAGIVVVNIHKFSTADEIKQNVSIVGEIFGGKSVQKAREFNAYFDKNVKFVRSRTAKIAHKKRVLSLSFHSGNFNTIRADDIGAEYIRIAGGINASSQEDFKVSTTINEEQVLVFNPDIIITYTAQSAKAIRENPAFKTLKAIKNKQVFVVPSGVFLWGTRSAEGALQPLWLAKVLYPELFEDLNLGQKVREFYEKFYHYKLSDEELESILNPVR